MGSAQRIYPLEFIAAREIADQQASRVEDALHSAFGPDRINASREFFRIDPHQVEALLEILPGRDVTPRISDQAPDGLRPEDREAVLRYNRITEAEFLESFGENGAAVYERVLAIGKRGGMQIRWGKRDSPCSTPSPMPPECTKMPVKDWKEPGLSG